MKVLEINSTCELGSTGRNVIEIADYLNNKGIECYIAHTSGASYKNEYIIGNALINKIHAFLSRIIGWQEIYSIYPTIKLIQYINKMDFDVINLNNIHSNYLSYPLLMRSLIKTKRSIVLTLHDCWFYTGKCTHYTNDNCFKWQKKCGNCPRLKKDIASWFFDFTNAMLSQKAKLYKKAAGHMAVIGVSEWITEEAKKSILENSTIITRVYNWIDTAVFKPREKNKDLLLKLKCEGKKVLLGVAVGWNDDKGLSDYIKLAGLLSQDYKIILVGEKIEERELPDKIQIVGKTKTIDELVDYYNMADCFLSLSTEESFGKVVAEALACGTPAVVYNCTASPELVGEKCGHIVEAHHIRELMFRISEICNKGKQNYIDECRKFALINFDKDRNIEMYLKIFGEIGRI